MRVCMNVAYFLYDIHAKNILSDKGSNKGEERQTVKAVSSQVAEEINIILF